MYDWPRNDILSLIPISAMSVLDVGCACGWLGRALKARGTKRVIGVEVNPQSAKKAKKFYDNLLIGNVENMKLPFNRNNFDCIVYADVLEHLHNPWGILQKHRDLLASNGLIIASIPNIQHVSIIWQLLLGKWEYQEAGILDSTHLRFFTLREMKELFESSGYRIVQIKRIFYEQTTDFWLINKLVGRICRIILRDFWVYQYLIVGRKLIKGVLLDASRSASKR